MSVKLSDNCEYINTDPQCFKLGHSASQSVSLSFRKAWHLGVREVLAGAASISCRIYPVNSSLEEAGGPRELSVGGRSSVGGDGPPYMRRPSG